MGTISVWDRVPWDIMPLLMPAMFCHQLVCRVGAIVRFVPTILTVPPVRGTTTGTP
jgi:hypothetical protein